jgi:hypothetical protein
MRRAFRNRSEATLIANFGNLLDTLNSIFNTGNSKFIYGDVPMTTDVILYSYLSPLLAIPQQLRGPWEDVKLARLRGFLLDFDDWLWQLSSAGGPLTSTAMLLTPPQPPEHSLAEEDEEAKPVDWKANAMFITLASAVAASVIYLGGASKRV